MNRPNEPVDVRILITGSRTWTNQSIIRNALTIARISRTGPNRRLVVVHGAAPGADTIAADLAEQVGLAVEAHPADWDTCHPRCRLGHRRHRRGGGDYCPTAGHRRNQAMVDLGAAACLAFPVGEARGTRHCMERAAAAGIPVLDYGAAAERPARPNAPDRLLSGQPQDGHASDPPTAAVRCRPTR